MKVHLKYRDAGRRGKELTHHFPGERLVIVLELTQADKEQIARMPHGEPLIAFADQSGAWTDEEVRELLDRLQEHRVVLPRG